MNFQNTKRFISTVALNASGALFLAVVAQGQATATAINGLGSPSTAIPGGTVINFESANLGSFSTQSFGNVTISGIGGNLNIDNTYGGQFNTQGIYLQNSAGNTNGIRFDFSSPVSQFAFNFGASDFTSVLSAYDVSNNLIESVNGPITNAGNAGNYVGLANSGISYATLTLANDYILVDNFTFSNTPSNATAVPEPFTIIGTLIGGTAAVRMRKKLKAVAK